MNKKSKAKKVVLMEPKPEWSHKEKVAFYTGKIAGITLMAECATKVVREE